MAYGIMRKRMRDGRQKLEGYLRLSRRNEAVGERDY